MKILEFDLRIPCENINNGNHVKIKIPYEHHGNHSHPIIPREDHENYENLRI
jgi:hypothetical protein